MTLYLHQVARNSPVTINLVGELNQQVVIRDAHGKPAGVSGYVQGRMEPHDAQEGRLLFRGATMTPASCRPWPVTRRSPRRASA